MKIKVVLLGIFLIILGDTGCKTNEGEWVMKPSIMYNNELYLTANTIEGAPKYKDLINDLEFVGKVESSTLSTKLPKKNFQINMDSYKGCELYINKKDANENIYIRYITKEYGDILMIFEIKE